MFCRSLKREIIDLRSMEANTRHVLDAIKRHVPSIEFTPQGEILDANNLLLGAVGYELADLKGQHHRILCSPECAASDEYRDFWPSLARGEARSGVFERRTSDGRRLWLEATYFPIQDEAGAVMRIVKIAADVTAQMNRQHDQQAVLQALDLSQAVIEFSPDGNILTANANFLKTVGYNLDQVVGQHHRIFCTDDFYTENPQFWAELKRGEFKQGLFQRVNAHGDTLWLEATYNPIMDDAGNVEKVIKFASDVTRRVEENLATNEAAILAREIADKTEQNAIQGSELLKASVRTSNDISSQVNHVVELIQNLNEHSKNIEKIVATIGAVAEQTNLLALNAAIEAARAGEQGRGFAVVADEVRQLAARTSQSTDEIAAVVRNNNELTATVTASMGNVVSCTEQGSEQIAQVTNVMEEIHAGACSASETIANLAVNVR